MARTLFVSIVCVVLSAVPVSAEIKVVEADSTSVLGDNDSKVDARRIAARDAQRKALEQAGTFVASLTQVKEYRLTKDQVTAYAAGIVETEIVVDEARGTAARPEHYVKARCRVDTDVLVRQIDGYRENEELREQLEAAAKEQEALRKERDALQRQLSAEQDRAKAEEARKKLDRLLTAEESIADTGRIWARIAPSIDFYGGKEIGRDTPAGGEQAAIEALHRAIAGNTGNVRARILLASLLEQQQEYAAAEGELRTALQHAPKNHLLHLRLGIVLREQGRLQEALKEFRVIEHKRPNQPQMLFQTGLTHKAGGNCRMASAYMKRLLLYTKKNDRPAIAKLKPNAKAVIEKCGDQPQPKRKQAGR